MGANAQTSVPAFVSGQVLTAQQQTEINTGVPVFSGTATRDAAFGGTGEKTLAEGQLAYLEDLDLVQYYDGSNWLTLGPTPAPGLELVKAQTIGTTVSTVTVTDAFSSTYDNYLITVSGGVASTLNGGNLQLGATSTGYYQKGVFGAYNNNTIAGAGYADTSVFEQVVRASTDSINGHVVVMSPNLTKRTYIHYQYAQDSTTGFMEHGSGYVNNTTAYTAFTFTTSTGTWTGGTIRVYGYKN